MTGIYLLLGSNLGDREQCLLIAQQQLAQQVGKVQAISSIYQTEAWQMNSAPDFLNRVILVNSSLEPLKVLTEIIHIETGLGRVRRQGYQNRIIDIDILYYNHLVLNHPELTIPHPRISQRRFVLEPLAEIAPNFIHPQLRLTNRQLLDLCRDKLSVVKL